MDLLAEQSVRRIVVLGCGFGGLSVARKLDDELAPRRGVELTVVADRSHFLFTPLWASVAGGSSRLSQVQMPLRAMLDDHVRIVLDRATTIDLDARAVIGAEGRYPFDFLVLATGAETDWRGNPDWEASSLPCKSGRDAVDAFETVEAAFRRAATLGSASEIRSALTFMVAGAGPTGVELIGQLVARIRQDILPQVSSRLASEVRLMLVEPQGSILPDFAPPLRPVIERLLHQGGVDVRLNDGVVSRRPGIVELASGEEFGADSFFWCGGVRPPGWFADAGLEVDSRGRALVHRTLQAVGHHGVYVIGDAAGAGDEIPMKADVAHEQGEIAARNIVADLSGRSRKEWSYTPAMETISFGRTDGVVMWGQNALEGRAAHAVRGTYHSRLVPGALRKVSLFRDLFAGTVGRRAISAERLLE